MPDSYTYLFVYGTLRGATQHPMSRLLSRFSISQGKGYFHGRLFWIENYPGAVFIPNGKYKVWGDLHQVRNSGKLWHSLDTYEDYFPDSPEESLFIRQQIPIQFPEKTIPSWAYLYNQTTEGLSEIRSGDFLLSL